MRYTIDIEKSPRNYAAYVPDVPGCVATGASEAEVIRATHVHHWHKTYCPAH